MILIYVATHCNVGFFYMSALPKAILLRKEKIQNFILDFPLYHNLIFLNNGGIFFSISPSEDNNPNKEFFSRFNNVWTDIQTMDIQFPKTIGQTISHLNCSNWYDISTCSKTLLKNNTTRHSGPTHTCVLLVLQDKALTILAGYQNFNATNASIRRQLFLFILSLNGKFVVLWCYGVIWSSYLVCKIILSFVLLTHLCWCWEEWIVGCWVYVHCIVLLGSWTILRVRLYCDDLVECVGML